jgi:hypothetical protein
VEVGTLQPQCAGVEVLAVLRLIEDGVVEQLGSGETEGAVDGVRGVQRGLA